MEKAISKAGVACAVVLLLGGLMSGGCGSGHTSTSGGSTSSSATRDAPAELFGTWRLVSTSGGITGQGYPVTPDTEAITFSQDGTVLQIINKLGTKQSTYQVTRRKTIFGDAILPVITYTPTALNDVILQVDAQHLAVGEEANDGYNREYERITP